MKLIELIRYRKEIVEEHARKLAAIDVLLGKPASSPAPIEPLIKQPQLPKGQLVRMIQEAVGSLGEQFTTNEILAAMKATGSTVRRWDVMHALWRMEKAGKIFVPESRKGRRPKTYQKNLGAVAVIAPDGADNEKKQ